jgi:hypothetical protein
MAVERGGGGKEFDSGQREVWPLSYFPMRSSLSPRNALLDSSVCLPGGIGPCGQCERVNRGGDFCHMLSA